MFPELFRKRLSVFNGYFFKSSLQRNKLEALSPFSHSISLLLRMCSFPFRPPRLSFSRILRDVRKADVLLIKNITNPSL
jgi:hypothetical protein